MPIELYPNIAKVKRNGVYQNLPGFVQTSGDTDIKAMIATSETSTTAQFPHKAGSYFILNDVLYQADDNIAVNDIIAVGTNCHVEILGNDVEENTKNISELRDAVNEQSNGNSLLIPYRILTDVLYSNLGIVRSYQGATTYVFKLEAFEEYTVTETNETFCVYGLSNTLYSDADITVASHHNDQSKNYDTFVNTNGYQYLYITKNNSIVERKISVTIPLVNKVLSDNRLNAIDISVEHLKLLADYSYDKTTSKYVKSTDGTLVSRDGFYATDFIDVSELKRVILLMPVLTSTTTHAGLAFYDSSEQYLSGLDCNIAVVGSSEIRIIDIPADVTYIRVTCRESVWSSFFVKSDDIYFNTYDLTNLETRVSEIENRPCNYGMQLFEKIGVIGDSISVGWAKDKNGNNSRRNTGISWAQQMARRLGCTVYNLGASGVDPSEWFQPEYEFAEYCYSQYQSVGACDLYIIGMGLNQMNLGTISDIDQTDYTQNGDTFYGQYARIIQTINHDHPNAIVMCLTEPTTAIQSFDQAVRNICNLEYINAELVDLENDYFELFNTPEIIAELQPDNRHFTPYGYSLIAKAMVDALNDYISKNTAKFKYVGVAVVT